MDPQRDLIGPGACNPIDTKPITEATVSKMHAALDRVAPDPVNNPAHYKQGGVDVLDVLEELGVVEGFCLGNVVKYAVRAGVKDPAKELEDFRKGQVYARRLVAAVGRRLAREAK